MKSLKLLIFLSFINSSFLFSQAQYQKKYHISSHDDDCTIGSLINGNLIFTSSIQNSSTNFNLTTTDSAGNVIWSKTYDSGGGSNQGYFPVQVSDGNIIITGNSPAGLNGGVLVAKIDTAGTILWAKSVGGNQQEVSLNPVVETFDNGLAITAWIDSMGGGNHDIYLIRTDSAGILQWAKSFGGTDYEETAYMVQTKDSGFIFASETRSFNAAMIDIFVVKTDSLGNLQWSKKYGRPNNDFPYAIDETPDGGYIVSGLSGNQNNLFLLKIDSLGSIEWAKIYKNFDYGLYCKILPGFEIITCGQVFDSISSNYYPCLMKTDSLGNVIWNEVYQEPAGVGNFALTHDNGFALMCLSAIDTLLVVKTDSMGLSGCNEKSINMTVQSANFTEVSIIPIVDSGGVSVNAFLNGTAVSPYSVYACTPNAIIDRPEPRINNIVIYPNPTKNEVNVYLKDFTNMDNITIGIYDLSGRLLIEHNFLFAGNRINIKLNALNSGLYYMFVIAGQNKTVQKLAVIK